MGGRDGEGGCGCEFRDGGCELTGRGGELTGGRRESGARGGRLGARGGLFGRHRSVGRNRSRLPGHLVLDGGRNIGAHGAQDVPTGRHVGLEQTVGSGILPVLCVHCGLVFDRVLRLRFRVKFEPGRLGRIGQRHPVDPALPAIRAQDQPVDTVALEQLDLVPLVHDADLRRPQLIRRVEQADHPIADGPAFVVVERLNAGGLEGHVRSLGRGPKRIRAPNLLQRRSPPARQHRLVDRFESRRGPGFDAARRSLRQHHIIGLLVVTALLAHEDERGPCRAAAAGGGDRRRKLLRQLLERGGFSAE